MGIVISIAEKVGEYLANSITDKIGESVVSRMREHIGYVIDYDSNMKTLKTETDKLGVIQKDVQHSVDEAKKNGQWIVPGVESWLTNANQIIEKVNKLLEDEATVVNKRWMGGLCPDLISRYELSWEAKKKTQDVSGLRAENTWLNYADFESRMSIMEEIMAAQKDDNVNAIGICGLGGVGKTTMVEKVRERAKAEKLFDEIVMTVVTQTPDLKKIQDEIARKLDLKLNEDDDLRERAVSLRNKLMDCKRVLVILDDVWEGLDLKAIGIPVGGVYKGCKVMLTSRTQDACIMTGTLRNFTIGVLSEQEAWNLFKEKAGNSVDSPDLNGIAKEVAKECGGLPIAIVTVGSALKGKEERVWKNALGQLKKANPENIPGMEKYVYQSIKMSYDFLDSEAKSFLLLCCLFHEDTDIWFQNLIYYGMGLGLFKGVDALAEATDRAYALMDKLKGFYLLLDGSNKRCVKVHDVVRDVIRFIATQGKEVFMYGDGQEVKEWLTENIDERSFSLISNKVHHLPDRLDCPKLELLLLMIHTSKSPKAPDDLFEGMKELKVLHLHGVMFLPSLPRSLTLLTKLRALFLTNCQLENVSIIGELKALVTLGFQNSSLKELQGEIGNLTNLRSLSLTGCGRSLKRISPGVISSLKRLEKLYLRNSNVQWVVEEAGKGENTVNLGELLSLSNLTHLDTFLPNAKFPRGNNPLFENLVRFAIVINDGESESWSREDALRNELELHLDTMIPVDGWINVLLKKTEILRLTLRGVKNVLNDLITPESLVKVKSLRLYNCEGLEYLIDTVDLVLDNIFPNLESLKIYNVDNLKMICHGELPVRSFRELRSLDLNLLPEMIHLWKNPIEVVSLSYLRRVVVETCDKLENLFSQSIASGLEQLEVLQIQDCKMIEEIVEMEKEEHGKSITKKIRFPKLNELTLVKLPNIIGFCKNMDGIEFPQLSTLCLQNLPEFRSFCPNCLASEGSYDIATQHLFNQKNIEEGHADLALTHLTNLELKSLPKLTHLWKMGTPGIQGFQNLQWLEVEDCQSLKYIFTPSIAKLLVKLEKLWVSNCAIVEIVGKDQEGGEENEEATKVIVFPQLNQLHLKSLPNLINFGAKPYTFECPVLKQLTVYKSSMKVLLPTFQSIGNQRTITVRSHEEVHEQQIIFPSLEVLTLEGEEDNVEGILDGQLLTHSSCNLRKIHVIKCNQLLAVPWNWLPGLQKLEKLTTEDCDSLVEVFEERDAVLLPMLKNLELYNLPKLKHLFNEKLLFPTCLFPNLKSLDVWSCGNLRNLFSPFMAGALVHLEELIIGHCEMMEEIVVKGENEEADRTNKIVIPQLKSLQLYSLPNLTSFGQSHYAFDLPLLEEVHVQNCPKMKAFSLGNLSTPKLQEVEGVWMGDLNNTIQELFERERKKLEVNQEIGQEEHLVNESEVNQEIVQEEESEVNQEIEQEEHLVKESEVNQEVGHEEHLDNNDDDHEN